MDSLCFGSVERAATDDLDGRGALAALYSSTFPALDATAGDPDHTGSE
jgi:hypothetical protein